MCNLTIKDEHRNGSRLKLALLSAVIDQIDKQTHHSVRSRAYYKILFPIGSIIKMRIKNAISREIRGDT